MFQQVLPFDDLYAWDELIRTLKAQRRGDKFVFYGIGKKITFTRLANASVSIATHVLDETLSKPTFEVTFMTSILKDSHKHLHRYEKSASRSKDWKKQIYRCADPDCRTYMKAELIIGKRADCHECGEEIIIDKEQVKNATIVGLCCSKSQKAIAYRAAKTSIANLFAAMGVTETLEPKVEINEEVIEAGVENVDQVATYEDRGFVFPDGAFEK